MPQKAASLNMMDVLSRINVDIYIVESMNIVINFALNFIFTTVQ